MYSSIRTIKANAREKLLSHTWTAVFFTISHILVTNLFTLCIGLSPSGGVFGLVLYLVSNFILNLIYGLFQTGIAAFYLKVATNNQPSTLLDLFHAFTHGPDRALKVTLPLTVIYTLCTLPYTIYCIFFMPEYTLADLFAMKQGVMESMMIAYFISVIGELIYYLISLNFAPVYFMLVDMPNLSAKKTLKMSMWLMKGSRLRLLGLELSFLPLQFISLLTFGIGNLWVTPYMNTASAEFYLDLSDKRTNQQ